MTIPEWIKGIDVLEEGELGHSDLVNLKSAIYGAWKALESSGSIEAQKAMADIRKIGSL